MAGWGVQSSSSAPPAKALPPSAIEPTNAPPVELPRGVPQGVWRVPPEQLVLKKGETDFDLHAVVANLTVVISTSVGEFTPDPAPVIATLESLQDNVALHWCRKLLVFDKVPSQNDIQDMRSDPRAFKDIVRGPKWSKLWTEKRQAYLEYCAVLKAMKDENHPALFNVELIFLQEFGHLFGTVKKAFEYVNTRFVFVTQHDLALARRFVSADVQRVLEALNSFAKYILLNRDVNSGDRTHVYFRMENDHDTEFTDASSGPALTGVSGFSDQAHFARVDWYINDVIGGVTNVLGDQALTCMEHVLHESFKERPWDGTYLYGSAHGGPFIYDFVHGMQVLDQHGHVQGLPSMPARAVR